MNQVASNRLGSRLDYVDPQSVHATIKQLDAGGMNIHCYYVLLLLPLFLLSDRHVNHEWA